MKKSNFNAETIKTAQKSFIEAKKMEARNKESLRGGEFSNNDSKEVINREGRKLVRKEEGVKSDWSSASTSYDKYLSDDKSYHASLITPMLTRMLGDIKGASVLDIACGQGQIAEILSLGGAKLQAFDYSEKLIKIAQANAGKNKSNINYKVLDAQNFAHDYEGQVFDKVICVLAIQNIENIKKVLENIKRVINKDSKIYFVINHPAYRIPKSTEWGYTQEGEGKDNKSIQYRRVDKYMSEDKIKMDMNPGIKIESFKEHTYSYHRPLQYYFKLFSNNNFAVTRLEEWISNRTSEGKNAERENTARKEFPMFMCLEIKLV